MSPEKIVKDLFQQYLEICNQAIDANREVFPYKQMLQSAEEFIGKQAVQVSIIEDHPEASFDLVLADHKIQASDHEKKCENCSCGEGCQPQWRVMKTYLENVVSNPDEYIQNPSKLDWEWLIPTKEQN